MSANALTKQGKAKYNNYYENQTPLFIPRAGGVAITGPVTNNDVNVTNGLFTVLIDFGPGAFTGQSNWLEIGAATNGAGPLATLAPRQQLTPAPYAIFAESAGSASAAQLTSIGNNSGGYNNFFTGPAGNADNSGSYNTASGYDALHSNTGAGGNTASGATALFSNTIGNDDTALGFQALYGNPSGAFNTASGNGALYSNTTGYYNTASGANALSANTSGSANTAIGNNALTGLGESNAAGGTNNIALGNSAGVDFNGNESGNIVIGNNGVAGKNNVIRIGTPGQQTATYLAGIVYANGVALTGDCNAKENFQPVDNQAVLARVAALPVTQWNYKTDRAGVRHLGPMAQDFQAAFGLDGTDDKHISVVDEGGVALAAIQGLSQKLEETRAENAELRQRLAALKKILLKQKSN